MRSPAIRLKRVVCYALCSHARYQGFPLKTVEREAVARLQRIVIAAHECHYAWLDLQLYVDSVVYTLVLHVLVGVGYSLDVGRRY